MSGLPKRQRVAAYAVILRDGAILLSRLAPTVTPDELWTLPGGGLDHGEDPRDAVVREIHEETGLDAVIGETARVYSAHLPGVWRDGRRVDAHALRIVYEGWVAPDAPAPRVIEVGGSTMAADWKPVSDVLDGTVPVAPMVLEALADHRPFRHQRLGAYALVRRGDDVLLTRISERGFHTGSWTLPGGGVDHGESPRSAVLRELREECGVGGTVGELVAVHDDHFSGTAPSGRYEDFHAVAMAFAVTIDDAAEPGLTEADGTTDAVAWVPVADIESGALPVLDLVREALGSA
ncbi:NUDIX hydrolase [Nocardioides sp. Root1257]|uniref:NUDIX domain-containing protein n=1 Tax=unclassified Nocardioides TaxID=2615069 RepID=UPI0006FCDDF4|nr:MULTISPECIES: NUDIX domain-containing protein [unclassified Nocardioides]KQW46869.1 NUDIX hydrolase [Nocardioides sp. Root1257]KRC43616.1 NUDIX hydrolase [Nocardioides sp. Root224]